MSWYSFSLRSEGKTPKAFASSSPGLLQPWVASKKSVETLKALANVPRPVSQRFQRFS